MALLILVAPVVSCVAIDYEDTLILLGNLFSWALWGIVTFKHGPKYVWIPLSSVVLLHTSSLALYGLHILMAIAPSNKSPLVLTNETILWGYLLTIGYFVVRVAEVLLFYYWARFQPTQRPAHSNSNTK